MIRRWSKVLDAIPVKTPRHLKSSGPECSVPITAAKCHLPLIFCFKNSKVACSWGWFLACVDALRPEWRLNACILQHLNMAAKWLLAGWLKALREPQQWCFYNTWTGVFTWKGSSGLVKQKASKSNMSRSGMWYNKNFPRELTPPAVRAETHDIC